MGNSGYGSIALVLDSTHALVKGHRIPSLVKVAYQYQGKCHSRCMYCILKTVLVLFDPFGRSTCISPMPITFTVLPSAVVMFLSISL